MKKIKRVDTRDGYELTYIKSFSINRLNKRNYKLVKSKLKEFKFRYGVINSIGIKKQFIGKKYSFTPQIELDKNVSEGIMKFIVKEINLELRDLSTQYWIHIEDTELFIE